MRLSESMLFGDVLLPRGTGRAWIEGPNPDCGCAQDRAYLANGGTMQDWREEVSLIEMWPWLDKCVIEDISEKFLRVTWGDWTFEQLVDYVRKIEPSEPVQIMDETPTYNTVTEGVYA